MKLIDRIRPIASTQEYSEFAELWNGGVCTDLQPCTGGGVSIGWEISI